MQRVHTGYFRSSDLRNTTFCHGKAAKSPVLAHLRGPAFGAFKNLIVEASKSERDDGFYLHLEVSASNLSLMVRLRVWYALWVIVCCLLRTKLAISSCHICQRHEPSLKTNLWVCQRPVYGRYRRPCGIMFLWLSRHYTTHRCNPTIDWIKAQTYFSS